MAKISIRTIDILRKTIDKLKSSGEYQWGHMGSCNCGHLAQVVSGLDKKEIHQRAMERYGDWNEQLNDYCDNSGYPLDDIIQQLTSNGFSIEDLKNLERLADPEVLHNLPKGTCLRKNNISDVILYLKSWVELIESKLIEKVDIEESMLQPEDKKIKVIHQI